jgi:hypothetical protein
MTTPAIVEMLNKEIIRQIKTPEVAERWGKALGLSGLPLKTPAQFQQTARDGIRKWGAIVMGGTIKVD